MNLKQDINQDLKQALLGGDKLKSETLRVIKSVVLNEEIAQNKREQGLTDEEIIACLRKEVKKRQEAAELYKEAGSDERANKELAEKEIIEAYLPELMPDEEIERLIDDVVSKHGNVTGQTMGIIIGEVKKSSKGTADGATVARLVKSRLS